MSLVGRFQSAWLASLVVFGFGLNEWAKPAAAAEGKPAVNQGAGKQTVGKQRGKQAAVLETFTKPDGQAYFALKLSPQVAPPADSPHDVVILFDTSASQVGPYRVKALAVLHSLLASLSPLDRVALLAVDVNAARLTQGLVAPSGGAINQAMAALERRVPLGSTDMREALDSALAVYLNSSDGDSGDGARARSVVYIGDGVSTASFLPLGTIRRIVGQYARERATFSSYAIGPRLNGPLLAALANHTGGMVVSDEAGTGQSQFGGDLAAIVRGAVIWPVSIRLPEAVTDVYPRQTPPLRFDRDTVLVGSVNGQAIEAGQPLAVEVQAEMGGKPVTLKWNVVAEKSLAENAYLARLVEVAAQTDGIALPTVGSAGLSELRRWVNYAAQQLASMGERALAVGQTQDAAQLAREAERLDPDNAAAATVRSAAMRGRQPAAGDLRLVRAQSRQPSREEASAGSQPDAAEAADGELLDQVERQQRVVEGFLRVEVNNALNQANAAMGVDPEGTRDWLKLLLDKVQHAAELAPEVRAQLVDKIEAALRAASRKLVVKTELDLTRQQIAAESEARERINRELFLQEQKVEQLMARFGALMDEERYRDAEAIADIAEEIEPGRPGLRGAELTARMVGYTADTLAVLDMRRKGFVDAAFQIELSHVPTADEPPILYPDPEVWQLLTERRKKYKAVDLTQHGPNEAKILSALDDKTDLDFAEQPLTDVIEYLQTRHEINIQLDQKALSDAGVGSDTPISRNIKGITLRSALKLLLAELDLTYVIKNEVLMITSKTEAENLLSMRVYPVADLVIPPGPRLGGGMFNVQDDEAGGPAASAGFGAFAVKDDLKLSKKGGKSPEAPAPAAKAANPQRAGKPAAKEKAADVDNPAEQAVAGPQLPARRRGEKVEPIRIEFKDGDDVDAVWNDYFAARTEKDAPSEASVRETVRQLMKGHKFEHVIACIYAALRNQQGQPWMYEALGLAMQADQRSPDEIERVLLSVLDFASNPLEVMYLAQYMARSGLEKRALQLYQQASLVIPAAPQPYVTGLQLAQKLDDIEGIQWATLGILGQPWPNEQIEVWNTGWNAAQAMLERLKRENRKEEAEAYQKAIDEALGRDLVVLVSWTGEADVDLLVEEPAGSVCSFRIPYTLSGGIMLGDSVARSKKDELKAQGAQEAYVCPKGFNGDYRIMVRRVWGKVTADKVTVDVFWHYWSKKERTMRKQIDISSGEAVCVIDLQEGRRTEPLEQQQVVNAVANQLGLSMLFYGVQQQQQPVNPLKMGPQVAQQLNAQNDAGAAGSMARSRAKQIGDVPRGVNPINPFFMRGATGYQPVISTLPQGAQMFTTAVVSADRRYVRVTPIPIFSVVSQVNTFNFVSGQSGTSGGAGGGGFGGGGGAGGLGGFGGGRGGGGGGGI
ncbi:MAG TPA: hypothetical protein VG125_07080 [Pirellulales bacterium]|jgi:hypothetical protein|nr:hypothetical protein [Pirellulales bacterium]